MAAPMVFAGVAARTLFAARPEYARCFAAWPGRLGANSIAASGRAISESRAISAWRATSAWRAISAWRA
ncbi:MAG TPA: hypothetical protein VJ801_15095, partial [Polyangia bacterium]|nr:hypothetical protein [Polyangia bacterium]